ncbi:MAG: ABC transporter ATP-binding protein [Rhodospirillales bacterium 20-60-12]|nr:MAG: ABC transporter ATP-binding protein [Rhodospirillales bacterium 20-60-12]HQT66283.1 ABC transporter ATP-binding protein [Acetobacteraceae bacterium]
MAHLSIQAVSKSFAGKPVLQEIDLEIAAGTLLAVLGASGSGKTSLLRLIAGFERLDHGRICIGERLIAAPSTHLAPNLRGIGYVMQEGALFPHLSVAQNIAFGLPGGAKAHARRVGELLELAGLPSIFAQRAPHLLSGGEQQRVALARALAPAPQLILLDEPFSALDAALRVETRSAVMAALRAVGATAILVTHDQDEALSMGDQVAVLRAGRVVQVAAPALLYRQPVDAALARFIGDAILLPGIAKDGLARCGLGALATAPGGAEGRVEVMVRPEQIRLVARDQPGSVAACVRGVIFYGHDAVVTIDLADQAGGISARLFSRDLPRAGDHVGVTVDGTAIAYPAPIPVLGLGLET